MIERKLLINITARLLFAWVALGLICMLYAEQIMRIFLPWIDLVITLIVDEYNPRLEIVQQNGSQMLELHAMTVDFIPITSNYRIRAGIVLSAFTNVAHNLVPVVLLFSFVLAIPLRSWVERILSLVVSVVVLFLIIGSSTPFTLAGNIEYLFQDIFLQHGAVRNTPVMLHWMIFMETGGVWLLTILGALASLWLAITLSRKPMA